MYTGNKELIVRGGVPINKIKDFSFQTLVDNTFNRPVRYKIIGSNV